MKINNTNINTEQQEPIDLTERFFELQQENESVFLCQLGEENEKQVFMYRPLGRLEFKRLINDDRLDDMAKEEVICQACTLWPEEFDFENCDAGIPTMLVKEILKNSYLDSIDSRKAVLSYFRNEMYDLDNQITCIINEAFPECSIDEIESWGVAKTSKYLSRAEWKLQNLRGMNMVYDPIDEPVVQQPPVEQKNKVVTEEIGNNTSPVKEGKIETLEERQQRLAMNGTPKEKLTPEKLAELRAKYPDIPWDQDTILTEGMSGLKDNADVTSPALRPGW